MPSQFNVENPYPSPLPDVQSPVAKNAEITMVASVIIPVRRINEYVRESVPILLAHTNLEVLILPDVSDGQEMLSPSHHLRIVATGTLGPAEKRDIGAGLARGSILAFLDDDAYPAAQWLAAALPHFQDQSIAAVGGPTLTPPSDSFWQQVSGWALASRLCSGGAHIRYVGRGPAHAVDDWPSVNLLVRKADFEAVGGFNCNYYPGEDTKLCLDLTKRLGKRIIYEPAAVAFHHRRELFWGHFRQVGQYAVHRGFFAKRFPETSRRPSYFLPSLLVLGIVGGLPLALLSRRWRTAYWAGLIAYTLALAGTATAVGRRQRQPLVGAVTALAVLLTHIWYGLSFLRGLCMRNLVR